MTACMAQTITHDVVIRKMTSLVNDKMTRLHLCDTSGTERMTMKVIVSTLLIASLTAIGVMPEGNADVISLEAYNVTTYSVRMLPVCPPFHKLDLSHRRINSAEFVHEIAMFRLLRKF